MKKLFLAICLVATLTSQAQTPPCATVTNFTSTCLQTSVPRKFTLTFKVTTTQPATTVQIFTAQGKFNGLIQGVTVSLQGGQAQVSITYEETTPASTVQYTLAFTNSGGNRVCGLLRTDTLVACGNYCATLNYNANINGVPFSSNALATYLGPVLNVVGGIQAGPEKVIKVESTISNMQRRTKCPNAQPGSWQNVPLPPLTKQQLGLSASTQFTTTPTTAALSFPAQNYSSMDYGLTLATPANKINPACPEEYMFTLVIKITFANGCTLSKTFSNLTSLRP